MRNRPLTAILLATTVLAGTATGAAAQTDLDELVVVTIPDVEPLPTPGPTRANPPTRTNPLPVPPVTVPGLDLTECLVPGGCVPPQPPGPEIGDVTIDPCLFLTHGCDDDPEDETPEGEEPEGEDTPEGEEPEGEEPEGEDTP